MLENLKERQEADPSLLKVRNEVLKNKETEFSILKDSILCYKSRIYIPNDEGLKKQVLEETHETPYVAHPGATKMYQDLKEHYWWNGMKNDIA